MAKSKMKGKKKTGVETADQKPFCFYCGEHRADPNNKVLFNGYLDKDLSRIVCWSCSRNHYVEKAKTEFAGMYSEFPVYAEGSYGNTGE